jgi:hypothetical protein
VFRAFCLILDRGLQVASRLNAFLGCSLRQSGLNVWWCCAAVVKEAVYKLRQEVAVIPGEPGDAMDTS